MKLSGEERLLAVENLNSEYQNGFASLSFEHKKLLMGKMVISHQEQWQMMAELQKSIDEQYERDHMPEGSEE